MSCHHSPEQRSCRIRCKEPRQILLNNHYLVKIEGIPRIRQCRWCSLKSKRTRTTRKCDICNVPLCFDCTKPYHTQINWLVSLVFIFIFYSLFYLFYPANAVNIAFIIFSVIQSSVRLLAIHSCAQECNCNPLER